MINILILGQTPPPYGGQAVMIQNLLDGTYEGVTLYHLRMNFSAEIDEIGKFKFKKIVHLFTLMTGALYFRIRYNTKCLYYVPGGPNLIPVYRDIILLTGIRWMFTKIMFHFHAGSTYGMYGKIPGVLRPLFKMVYFHPDVAVRITQYNPNDPEMLLAKKEFIIENGIQDEYSGGHSKARNTKKRIIFTGLICRPKGILELIRACDILKRNNEQFTLIVIGKFESPQFKEEVMSLVRSYSLEADIDFTGILIGEQKLNEYYNGDIFCVPSHFETFGLVFLEAMQFSLPVVATNVGGIPALVKHGENGLLVEKGDHVKLAKELTTLLQDESLRNHMGADGRNKYLKEFTLEAFHAKFEKAFLSLQSD